MFPGNLDSRALLLLGSLGQTGGWCLELVTLRLRRPGIITTQQWHLFKQAVVKLVQCGSLVLCSLW